MKINVLRWLATAGAAGVLALILADSAVAQVLPGKRAANNAPPAAPREAAKAALDTPGEVRREARDAANDTKREAREATRDAREAPGEVRREARENVREAREDIRDARRNVRDINRATRAADFGVWFNTRGAGAVANGLVIADLATKGAFSTAGFREGDRIVSVNGQPIATEAQFVQYLTAPNTQEFSVVVFREGQQQTIALQPTVLTQGVVNYDPYYQYGLIIDDSSPNQIVVQRVYPRTPAYYAGLRAGDVIVGLGGQRIANLQAFTTALERADDNLALQVTRGGQTRELDLDVSSSGSVRTALRPNLDAQGQVDGQGRIDTRGGIDAQRGTTTPGAAAPDATRPGTPATPAVPGTPTRPVPPGTPTSPALPGTPTSPAVPRNPATPGGAPAAAPGAPAAAPGAPRAVPGAPAAPAAPRAGAGAGAPGGAGTPKN